MNICCASKRKLYSVRGSKNLSFMKCLAASELGLVTTLERYDERKGSSSASTSLEEELTDRPVLVMDSCNEDESLVFFD